MSKTNATVDSMFAVGAHFGYSKTRRHPSTAKFIFTTKNRSDIIDIEKTLVQLETAKAFVASLAGKVILFVGTKPEARAITEAAAVKLSLPYAINRWVGGVLTNFPEIKKRIARLEDLRDKKAKGELDVYTKKERLLIDEEIADMEKNFAGIVSMKKMPDAMFVIDPKKEHIAVTEAHKMHIPVIALLNTDCDMKTVEYPILANDGSTSSIEFFVNEIVSAYEGARKE